MKDYNYAVGEKVLVVGEHGAYKTTVITADNDKRNYTLEKNEGMVCFVPLPKTPEQQKANEAYIKECKSGKAEPKEQKPAKKKASRKKKDS